ncbi:hypothetical protein B1812_10825 [Methylocystis bryophila]|uniref:3',5'-cyclic-nucleotide phosphodiesterase n=1 Tax=Methylocystis bryophila TaxID=655015 RepID=A0A1W6MV63_9HYPH|nr:hypothetical protein B1812_10825 [Methylocystis bryophila]
MNRNRLFTLVTILASLIAPAAWAAGTAEQRAACQDDAFRLCSDDVPDTAAIEACLQRHIRSISPACQRQFGYAPGKAKTSRRQ